MALISGICPAVNPAVGSFEVRFGGSEAIGVVTSNCLSTRERDSENTVQAEATFGKLARGKKCESAVSMSPKIKDSQNIGDFSD